MCTFVDDLRFNERGNEVTLVKRRRAIKPRRSPATSYYKGYCSSGTLLVTCNWCHAFLPKANEHAPSGANPYQSQAPARVFVGRRS